MFFFLFFFTENLALWKEAWQNNSFYDASNYVYLVANRAVDGRKQDLSLEGGQCAVSIGSTTSEWRVDLGGISSIHHIFIHYMTNNKVWGTVSSKQFILIMVAYNTDYFDNSIKGKS